MEAWYKVATPRKEVRQGRSFNPDEFAIALEQIVAGTAPKDYQDPKEFFKRTCFTQALCKHAGMVLRRLSGETSNTSPVMALITQFGGGKTHTLATLYHIAKHATDLSNDTEVSNLLSKAELPPVENVRIAVFVGNAWDPSEGNETPWIDIARQISGEKGVKELGVQANTTAPGTDALRRVFTTADGPILILFDEVLNYLTRHRNNADAFRAFLGNMVRCLTSITNCAAMVSLPQSKPEMDDWELRWQDLITKEVGRVAKQLIANDESEISEVVRRRLFDDIGSDRIRRNVSKSFADWCFERRAQLPPEWTAVDTSTTENKARDFLRQRFEACYPFHPATLSVFQRKWQALSHYQQTRGTLAMLAQWVSWAYQTGFKDARNEPLITLGSAPLEIPEFRSIVLGQLGESRLVAAIDADISGSHSHARALDADTKGVLRNIHRRVGTTILFESSGGQIDKVGHLPELRFALGEPEIDTTSIDNAAFGLEDKSYFIRRVGSDGFKITHQPTMKKVVNDRRASLDEESEVIPAMRSLIQKEFERNANIPLVPFPTDGAAVQDTPRLTLVIADPASEWTGAGTLREQIAEWTKQRGNSPRLYPGSLVWCMKKPGRDLRDKMELWLAWRRVAKEIAEGTLGGDFDRTDRADIQSKVSDAEEAAKDEVWGGYRFAVLADSKEPDGLKTIDLGAGHSSSGESMCGRVLTALKSQALLNESVGAGYIERNWPPALKDSGAWPLASLRQSFLNGSLTRLLDPDAILRSRIVDSVSKGDFGLASGHKPDGTYERVWFNEPMAKEEVAFEQGVFLLLKDNAKTLKIQPEPSTKPQPPDDTTTGPRPEQGPGPKPEQGPEPPSEPGTRMFKITGSVPPEVWNRLGTKVIPKLRTGSELTINVDFTVSVQEPVAEAFHSELKQILSDLGLESIVLIE